MSYNQQDLLWFSVEYKLEIITTNIPYYFPLFVIFFCRAYVYLFIYCFICLLLLYSQSINNILTIH